MGEKLRRKAAAEKKNNFLQGIKTSIVDKLPLLEGLADKFVDTFEEVAERHTKTILDLYAKEIECLSTIDTKMKEAEHGIFIKTSSRPDIVAMIKNKKDLRKLKMRKTTRIRTPYRKKFVISCFFFTGGELFVPGTLKRFAGSPFAGLAAVRTLRERGVYGANNKNITMFPSSRCPYRKS